MEAIFFHLFMFCLDILLYYSTLFTIHFTILYARTQRHTIYFQNKLEDYNNHTLNIGDFIYDCIDWFLLPEVDILLGKVEAAGRCHRRRRRILSPATTRNYRRTRTDFLGIWTMFYYRYVRFNVKGTLKLKRKKKKKLSDLC